MLFIYVYYFSNLFHVQNGIYLEMLEIKLFGIILITFVFIYPLCCSEFKEQGFPFFQVLRESVIQFYCILHAAKLPPVARVKTMDF